MAKKFGDLFGNMDDVFSGAKISNFDLDDMLSRTRTFTEEVSKRSAEALELSRKKVECLDIKAKLSKAYERYGRLAYEAVQSNLSCSRRRRWRAVGGDHRSAYQAGSVDGGA